MFVRFRTQGLVFAKENEGEANQIFSVFTKDFGRIEILGKGIRKISSKLRPSIEILYLSEIEFVQGKIYKTLTDAVAVEKFKNLRKSLKRLSIAYKISEVLNSLIKGEEKNEKIWNLILETFKTLNLPNLPFLSYNLVYYYFFWNLIDYLGYKPQVYFCVFCGKKIVGRNVYFNVEEGGIICGNCFLKIKKGRKINPRIVEILKVIFKKNINLLKTIKIKKENIQQLKELSENYLKFLENFYEAKIS